MKVLKQGTGEMSNVLIMLVILGGWIALQAFILPRFGVNT